MRLELLGGDEVKFKILTFTPSMPLSEGNDTSGVAFACEKHKIQLQQKHKRGCPQKYTRGSFLGNSVLDRMVL